ncbi:MAG: hypothetical protein SFV21_18625 [Rhodospirillaceae bacterium]|nr:hypothetical protein [Rhodospirillaceae bacterium]
MNSFSTKTAVTSEETIAQFLSDMLTVTRKTYPVWSERLYQGYAECFGDRPERAKETLDALPLEDLYFAGVVAMEAAKIRTFMAPDQASELLAELATQVDAFAGRPDRLVSDLVFFIVGRIDLETGVEQMRMPYDLVVKLLLQKIGVEASETTRELMNDVVFRHNLGEPLARGVPAWWKAFAASFIVGAGTDDAATPAKASGRRA